MTSNGEDSSSAEIKEYAFTSVPVFTFVYINHEGKESIRNVRPISLFHGTLETFYPEPQWILKAFDIDKNAIRHFSMSKINKGM